MLGGITTTSYIIIVLSTVVNDGLNYKEPLKRKSIEPTEQKSIVLHHRNAEPSNIFS